MEPILIVIWVAIFILGIMLYMIMKAAKDAVKKQDEFIELSKKQFDSEADDKFFPFAPIIIGGQYKDCEITIWISWLNTRIYIRSEKFVEVKGLKLAYEKTPEGYQIHNKGLFKMILDNSLLNIKTTKDFEAYFDKVIDEAVKHKKA